MQQAAQGYASRILLSVHGNLGGVAITAAPVIAVIVVTSADLAAVRMPLRRREQAARTLPDRHPQHAVADSAARPAA